MATPPLCCKLTLLAGATETLPEGTDVQLEGEGGGVCTRSKLLDDREFQADMRPE